MVDRHIYILVAEPEEGQSQHPNPIRMYLTLYPAA
jgi:hypothetical protein